MNLRLNCMIAGFKLIQIDSMMSHTSVATIRTAGQREQQLAAETQLDHCKEWRP